MITTPQPIRDIQSNAKYLMIYCYELVNWTNLYGHCPMKSNSLDYLKAKRKALKMSKNAEDTEMYNYLKNNF
jgi:hypothetical protein